MATLTGQSIASSYEQLLSLPDGGGNTSSLVAVTDGDGGTTFCISLTDASTGKAVLAVDGSHASGTEIQIDNSAGDGDSFLSFQLSGTSVFTMGVDDGDSDKFKIGTTAIGTDTALAIEGGSITMPNQPAFMVTPASIQSNIATGTSVTVIFGTERFDQGGDFGSNVFTAPVTGKYQLNFMLYLTTLDSAATYYVASIITSNHSYESCIWDPDFGQDAEFWTITGAALVDMDASDTALIRLVQSDGTAQTDISPGSYFSGYLAC
tara:strand:- start:72 stop:863 length:792 start_codon:yes stop_codon:yes gene_type:complete